MSPPRVSRAGGSLGIRQVRINPSISYYAINDHRSILNIMHSSHHHCKCNIVTIPVEVQIYVLELNLKIASLRSDGRHRMCLIPMQRFAAHGYLYIQHTNVWTTDLSRTIHPFEALPLEPSP